MKTLSKLYDKVGWGLLSFTQYVAFVLVAAYWFCLLASPVIVTLCGSVCLFKMFVLNN